MAYTTIDDPSQYFQIALYTGNGNDDKVITFSGANYTDEYVGQDIQGDLFWVKRTDSGTDHWEVMDTVRGIGTSGTTASLGLASTGDDSAESNTIKSVGSNSITLGTNPQVNRADEPYICYIWKAGTTSSATESGSNNAYSRSINTTSKIMISAYTGIGSQSTLAHGLGSAPNFFFMKNRGGGGWSWYAYHHKNTTSPNTDSLYINNSDATVDDEGRWGDQYPDGTELKLGTNGGINADGDNYLCLAWTEVQGFSKMGGYTGNGADDGTFVNLGFRPAFVWLKKSSGSANWQIRDYTSDVFNENSDSFLSSSSNDGYTTSTNNIVDFLSNGFKTRGTGGDHNGDGDKFVYIAFAKHPFVTSGGVPCTAQ